MLRFTIVIGALIASEQASATSCVEVDTERDNLSADERSAARVLFEDALADTSRVVASAPCDEKWSLSHTRLGNAVTVRVSALGRSDKLTVDGVEELSIAYERLIRAVVEEKSAADSADRSSVTTADANQKRVSADSLAYAKVGFGGLPTSGQLGPALGGGYRFELDRIGIDVGFVGVLPTADGSASAISGQLAVLYFVDPEASASPYVGGGLGVGATGGDEGSFFGVMANANLGYCFLRETQIRLFPQLDLTAPIGLTDRDAWVPMVSLTAGVAFIPPSRARRSGP